MKLVILLCGVVTLLLLSGFTYLAITDIPVEKTLIKKTISNERFF